MRRRRSLSWTGVSRAVGRGRVGVRVLMSYVCDAETPKLAHAIVNVYVYPL